MKTYYDGEEREILGIEQWTFVPNKRITYWMVTYRRGESIGTLLLPAIDELDAMRKFPDELAKQSINPEDT